MHWKHSNYQVLHQLAGSCHTIDEAILTLRLLLEDREFAVEVVGAENDRSKAKMVFAKNTISSDSEDQVEKLNAQANIAEQVSRNRLTRSTMVYCIQELNFINSVLEYLIPMSKYSHLPELDRFQAVQVEETFYDHYWKMYLNLITNGHIPVDLLQAIKLHPLDDTLMHLDEYLRTRIQSNPKEASRITKLDLFTYVDTLLPYPNISNMVCHVMNKVSLKLQVTTNDRHSFYPKPNIPGLTVTSRSSISGTD